jgi:hypothetical protein
LLLIVLLLGIKLFGALRLNPLNKGKLLFGILKLLLLYWLFAEGLDSFDDVDEVFELVEDSLVLLLEDK